MAGEIIKTRGVVLAIHPWSKTSHVVSWLTGDHGVVTTIVKGAVRPKSAFLGQYDLFYTCDFLYYARSSEGNLHALREVVPINGRDFLRGRWRETSLAGYATDLVRSLAPPDGDSRAWMEFLENFLDTLTGTPASLVRLEMKILHLAGLSPDFSGMDPGAQWTSFSIESGRCGGEGSRQVRLSPRTTAALRRPDAPSVPKDAIMDAVRFLGMFLAYHLDRPAEIRRSLLTVILCSDGVTLPRGMRVCR